MPADSWPAVLQGVQAEVDEVGRVGVSEHGTHAAFVVELVARRAHAPESHARLSSRNAASAPIGSSMRFLPPSATVIFVPPATPSLVRGSPSQARSSAASSGAGVAKQEGA